jgi:hypothetical protein
MEQLEFRGRKEERTIAERVFDLMASQGTMFGLDTPIRQSLHNLIDYFVEQKILRRDPEAVAKLIEAAVAHNDHIFGREERDEDVIYVTTRRGRPGGIEITRPLPPRTLHAAPKGGSPTPRRKAIRRPPMSPFWVRAAIRQLQPLAPTQPQEPMAEPAAAVVAPEEAVPVVVRPARVTTMTLPDGAVLDWKSAPEEIVARYGDQIGKILREALDRDFRLISFGDVWSHEDRLEHFSKGRLNEIRRYILEEEAPLSDVTILGDLFFKGPRDPDYDQWSFSLNARLLREKKEFEYVGVPGGNLWAVKGLPTIGSRFLKASEIGQDYSFLLDDTTDVERPQQWEHFLTFYEYQNGVLPYDALARTFFPPALLADQRSAYLRFEIPQHYEAYAVEVRYPSGNRGGWLWGLDEFFHSSLVPGALLLISRTEEPNIFILQYVAAEAQEQRLLTYDERRSRYTFEDSTFYCAVEESLLLDEARFAGLRNSNPLPPTTRKRPADVVAYTFTKVGKKKGAQYRTTLENLFPAVNIERPISMALLQQILAETDVFSPGEEEGVYLYTPAKE